MLARARRSRFRPTARRKQERELETAGELSGRPRAGRQSQRRVRARRRRIGGPWPSRAGRPRSTRHSIRSGRCSSAWSSLSKPPLRLPGGHQLPVLGRAVRLRPAGPLLPCGQRGPVGAKVAEVRHARHRRKVRQRPRCPRAPAPLGPRRSPPVSHAASSTGDRALGPTGAIGGRDAEPAPVEPDVGEAAPTGRRPARASVRPPYGAAPSPLAAVRVPSEASSRPSSVSTRRRPSRTSSGSRSSSSAPKQVDDVEAARRQRKRHRLGVQERLADAPYRRVAASTATASRSTPRTDRAPARSRTIGTVPGPRAHVEHVAARHSGRGPPVRGVGLRVGQAPAMLLGDRERLAPTPKGGIAPVAVGRLESPRAARPRSARSPAADVQVISPGWASKTLRSPRA